MLERPRASRTGEEAGSKPPGCTNSSSPPSDDVDHVLQRSTSIRHELALQDRQW